MTANPIYGTVGARGFAAFIYRLESCFVAAVVVVVAFVVCLESSNIEWSEM